MAVQDTKSQIVTDLDASPVVKTNTLEIGGVVREAIASVELTATEAGGAANSVWRMTRVPARARVVAVEIANDDLDSEGTSPALAADVGLYETNGGAAKDADFFASAITDLQSATAAWMEVTYESGVVDEEADSPKALWEQLADSDTAENRGKHYDVAFTVTTAAFTGAAGSLALKVKYVLPE